MTDFPLDTSTFDDILERYRRNPRYGDIFVNTVAPHRIQEVQQACEAKDYAHLRALVYVGNAFRRDIFARLTGITLPGTEREGLRCIDDFVGREIVECFRQAREQERKRETDKRLKQRLHARQVQSQGFGTLEVDTFLQRLITLGYTSLIEQKRGAVPQWFLSNTQGSGYTFRHRDEKDYIELLLEQRNQQGALETEKGIEDVPSSPQEP